MSKRKRSVANERRVFNPKWEQEYFIIDIDSQGMLCLICNQVIKTVKGDNAKQHYRRHNEHHYAKLIDQPRKACVENLKRNVKKQTSCMSNFVKSGNCRVEASYRVAYYLGVAGKPFSDGELVKKIILDVVKCVHPKQEGDYSAISLSRHTIQRRQQEIARGMSSSLQKKVKQESSLFSLVVDESTDITDSAQLLIFIRSLLSDFKLTEDLLSMETLSSRTCGKGIFNSVKGACIREKLNLKNLRGICTDGAPAMTGSVRGFVSRFSEYVSTEFNNQLTNLHCIIHQEALCVKSMTLNSTLKCVNGVILFIRSRALNHRQFRELLELSDNSCEDVLYHTAVRWLSQSETSRRVLQLRKEIIEFYSAKQKSCPLNNGDFNIPRASGRYSFSRQYSQS